LLVPQTKIQVKLYNIFKIYQWCTKTTYFSRSRLLF